MCSRRLAAGGACYYVAHRRWMSSCDQGEGETVETAKKDRHARRHHSKGLSEVFDLDGGERYAAYTSALARLKVILLRAKNFAVDSMRYVAYSSDIGESMRPILNPMTVNLTYGIAITYVLADAGMEVKRKHHLGYDSDVLVGTAAHRLTFHAAVSLALPAVIIHTAVHQTHKWLEHPVFETMPRVHRYGPTAVGLAIIPFLPILDHPAEYLLDAAFDKFWPKWRLGEDDDDEHEKSD